MYIYTKCTQLFIPQTSSLRDCVGQGHVRDKDDVVDDIDVEAGVHAQVSNF